MILPSFSPGRDTPQLSHCMQVAAATIFLCPVLRMLLIWRQEEHRKRTFASLFHLVFLSAKWSCIVKSENSSWGSILTVHLVEVLSFELQACRHTTLWEQLSAVIFQSWPSVSLTFLNEFWG